MNKTAKAVLGVAGFIALIYAFKVIRSKVKAAKEKKAQEEKDAALNANKPASTPAYLLNASFPLQLNSKGAQVQVLQKWLGIEGADGVFGNQTLSVLINKTGQINISESDYDAYVKAGKPVSDYQAYFYWKKFGDKFKWAFDENYHNTQSANVTVSSDYIKTYVLIYLDKYITDKNYTEIFKYINSPAFKTVADLSLLSDEYKKKYGKRLLDRLFSIMSESYRLKVRDSINNRTLAK